ncbi:uncharacterized protein LOC130966378 [Arachis stenosperma]|uniref:uncharacterized protein LOC130966378 n=1 Tax=Arachis stenosperma TaxID=217475 RepID=UPI0025AC2A4E|nr:uncharacterized protein LOC130966378 [Arachis stenosperma]
MRNANLPIFFSLQPHHAPFLPKTIHPQNKERNVQTERERREIRIGEEGGAAPPPLCVTPGRVLLAVVPSTHAEEEERNRGEWRRVCCELAAEESRRRHRCPHHDLSPSLEPAAFIAIHPCRRHRRWSALEPPSSRTRGRGVSPFCGAVSSPLSPLPETDAKREWESRSQLHPVAAVAPLTAAVPPSPNHRAAVAVAGKVVGACRGYCSDSEAIHPCYYSSLSLVLPLPLNSVSCRSSLPLGTNIELLRKPPLEPLLF